MSSTTPYRRRRIANFVMMRYVSALYGWGMCPQGIIPSASTGGLRTVIRLHNYGSDCPQPRPTKNAAPSWRIGDGQMDSKYWTLSSPIAFYRKNRAFGRAQQAHPRLKQSDLTSLTASDQPLPAVKVELWRLSFSLLPQKGGH